MPRNSERTRQKIVEAANRLFYRRGYNRTSFTDIVEEAGVPRGNIYYYFRAKDDILRAAIAQRLEIIDTMLDEWNRNYPDAEGRLKRFVQVLINSRETTARYGCPMGTLNAELAKDQPELQELARALFDRFDNYLREQFETAHDGDTATARRLALELLTRAQGVSMIAHVFGDPDLPAAQQASLDRWIEESLGAPGPG